MPKYITPAGDHERTFASILLGLLINPRVRLSERTRGAMRHLAALSTAEQIGPSRAPSDGGVPFIPVDGHHGVPEQTLQLIKKIKALIRAHDEKIARRAN
jgi:hypothetical protein